MDAAVTFPTTQSAREYAQVAKSAYDNKRLGQQQMKSFRRKGTTLCGIHCHGCRRLSESLISTPDSARGSNEIALTE